MKAPLRIMCGLLIVLLGCQRSLSKEEFEKYLADPQNGLVQQREVNGLVVQVAYRPAAVVIGRPVAKAGGKAPARYFLVSFSQDQAEVVSPARDFATYSSLLQTLAFRPQQWVILTTATGDTLPPGNSVLERTFGMGTSTRLLVAFPPDVEEQNFTFHLKEFGLGIGNLRFSFDAKDLERIPPLKPQPVVTDSI